MAVLLSVARGQKRAMRALGNAEVATPRKSSSPHSGLISRVTCTNTDLGGPLV